MFLTAKEMVYFLTLFAIPSRVYFRMKKFERVLTICYAHVQTLEGITSLIPNSNGKHIILWDIEGCTLEECKEALRKVQKKYDLSDIFIVSDAERSFRAYCYNQVDFKTYLKILLDTDYLDEIFFEYTVRRKKATLRTNSKKGRPKQKVVAILMSYGVVIPKGKAEKVIYDTGVEKEGLSIILGGE